MRQPGQALLELRGHGGAVNCVEWSPLRRGTLATGADDCQVLIWDLLNPQPHQHHHHHHHHHHQHSSSAINGGGSSPGDSNVRSPVASWQCEYEIGNLGWVPRLSSGEYGEWLGVGAGRGVWGVRLS